MTSTRSVAIVGRAVARALDRVGPGLYDVACSGGADSLALAHATIAAAGAAHVVVIAIDHGLVPGSARVAERVARWAIGQGAAAVTRGVTIEPRASLEAAARTARYAALTQVADELGLIAVLTGHTARDQVETVLMRIVRGTGPAGLAGIPAQRERFVRPLLAVARETIDAYVAACELPVWSDPMNLDRRLARVRMRTELLPALRRENPQLDAAVLRLAASAAEWLAVIDARAEPLARLPLDCAVLAREPAAIRKRAVAIALDRLGLEHDAVHLEQIDALVARPARGQVTLDLPGARIVRSYDAVAVQVPAVDRRPNARSARDRPLALEPPRGPYVLRAWQPGDRMRPRRLKGRSRKLSDLFIDAKIPRELRASARVLVRVTDHEIVWAEHVGLADGAAENLIPVAVPPGGSF